MLFVGHAPTPRATVGVAAPAAAETTAWVASSMPALAPTLAPSRAGANVNPRPNPASVVRPVVRTAGFGSGRKASAPRAEPAPPAVAATEGDSDTLAREASSLADARRALSRHDALSALQIVRGLRALPGRQLVPEELAVEAQALRGLGLDDDANAVETHLRVRFPDSVLGR